MKSWMAKGKFGNRRAAMKKSLAHYRERGKTKRFYQMLIKRSGEAKKKRSSLVPLEAIR